MKKITLTLLSILTIGITSYAQTNSTGVINLSSTSGLEYTAQIDITSTEVTLTLIGPSDRWLGIGFGASSMTSNKDVAVFTGTNLTDRTFQGIGSLPTLDTNQDWTITSNNIDTPSAGKRTLIATRALNTGETNDYVFSTSDTSINLVWARGNGATFSLSNHGGGNKGATSSGLTLGLNENNIVADFKMYPNPTSSKLNVILPNTIQNAIVNVYNILGEKVITKNVSNLNSKLNVSNWSKGVYLIEVSSNGFTHSKRFIKL